METKSKTNINRDRDLHESATAADGAAWGNALMGTDRACDVLVVFLGAWDVGGYCA